MKTLKEEIVEAKQKIALPFIIGDAGDMIRDIYNKLDLIMEELNKKEDKK